MISRKASSGKESKEPLSLLIRRKGENASDVDELGMNTDTLSTVTAYEMSKRGLGPKLYGLIKGGSIVEYIDSHTITSEESTDPVISRDFALSLAAIHAIQGLPLKQTSCEDIFKLEEKWIKEIPRMRGFIHGLEAIKKYNLDLDFVTGFDYTGEHDWLIRKCRTLKLRKNLILFDMNFFNCLVRNDAKEGQLRLVLIDYDLSQYNYRGIDLGAHFIPRNEAGVKDEIISKSFFPTLEGKRQFLRTYQQEIKRLNAWEDYDEDGIDSIDNLLIESLVGQCYYFLFWTSIHMSKADQLMNDNPSLITHIEFFLKNFLAFKEEVERLTA